MFQIIAGQDVCSRSAVSSFSGSIKQRKDATPRKMIAGKYNVIRENVPARGTEHMIQTADDRSIHPANLVSVFAIAAPIRPRLEKRAACIPESVTSDDVEEKSTSAADAIPRNPPITPRINCFFISDTWNNKCL
jgi:hypothetical protein